jgi:hypothetical protein
VTHGAAYYTSNKTFAPPTLNTQSVHKQANKYPLLCNTSHRCRLVQVKGQIVRQDVPTFDNASLSGITPRVGDCENAKAVGLAEGAGVLL